MEAGHEAGDRVPGASGRVAHLADDQVDHPPDGGALPELSRLAGGSPEELATSGG